MSDIVKVLKRIDIICHKFSKLQISLNIFQFMRANQLVLPVDRFPQNDVLNQRHCSSINLNSNNEKVSKVISTKIFLQIPLVEGLKFQAPKLPQTYQLPDMTKIISNQGKGNAFTPAPPVIRSENQKANARMVKKFNNRFEYIWVMVTENNHPANKIFADVYLEERLDNVNQNLQNLIAPEDYLKLKVFTRQGLSIKLMLDYYSYNNYIKRQIKNLGADPKILEIYVQKQPSLGIGIPTTNKIKNVENLAKFMEEQVKLDVQNSRKDKPYFNFIHQNSGPELFSRRSIIKNCLSHKSSDEFIQNNKDFIAMMVKHNKEQKLKGYKEIQKFKSLQNKYGQIQKKQEKWQKMITNYQQNFTELVQKHYPLEKQDDITKKDVLNWIIIQYCIQSPLYPVVNNTMRFSANNESVRPVSTYIKYLYDALRFYFTTKYREITYNVVYRGARVSLEEQRSFAEKGRYLWNLGFMSTSRSEKVAERFRSSGQNNPQANKKEFILIVIKIPSLANQLDHLWNQQGFFSLDRIPEISNYILSNEQEVLFNPLNVFQIQRWDQDHGVLYLQYGPQLQILQKKRQRIKLTPQEQDFLIKIAKLKENDFDKGQLHLQEGDPGAAVKYYELSDQTGSNLSFSQKSNYIKGLREIGSAEKMETILKNSLEEEKLAEKQLQASTVASSTFDQLETSIQTLTLYQQTTDYIGADEKVAQVSLQSSKKSIQTPTQQALLLEAQVYIKRAKAKFGIGETFDSIKQSIRSLKIIDELAQVNFCYLLWQLGNQFQSITRVKLSEKLVNLMHIYNDKKFLSLNIEKQKQKLLNKISEIREWDIKQTQIQINTEQKSQSKRSHKKAQKLLNQYFTKRDKRTDIQHFQFVFVKAYWQTDLIRINRDGISQKQQIQIREQLKGYQQQLFEVKNDYKVLFRHQADAYQVLYRNIYKTSIDVRACLESYNNNLFRRWEDYTRIQAEFEKETIDSAEVYWKHAEILYEYGQIIQRPANPNLTSTKTQAEKLADKKIHDTETVIKKLESSQSRATKAGATYTYHKSQLNRTLSRYFRSKSLEREQSRKLSLISNQIYKQSSLSSTQASQKSQYFKSLVDILLENNELCESDASINKSLYKVKNTCDLIESMNESSSIIQNNRSYLQRLKSCKKHFQDVVGTINKYQEKQIMERNVNMAHLYLLMGENQFRLGLISPARGYLNQANTCLRKAMKIDDEKYRENTRVNKEKLMLGNNTHLGCLRLEAHIVAHFGNRDQKQQTLENLLRKKSIMFATMNQPLSEADLNQSIGLMMVNMLIMHKELGYNFEISKKPYLDAIKIREFLLGPHNRFNARNYTQIVNLVAEPQVRQKNLKELTQYYKKAGTIYDRIDLSLDSTLIMHKMQLKSTFLIFSNKYPEACEEIIHDLQEFNQCPNKKLTLQSARELYRCSKFLLEQQKYQKNGIKWLKSTYKYVLGLEEFINKNYPMQDTDQRKFYILKLKNDILTTIIKGEYRIFNKEVDERYYKKYLETKEKYEKALAEKNNLV